MAGLVRTRSGNFSIGEAITLEALSDSVAAGNISRFLIPMDEALAGFPKIALTDAESGKILHGNKVSWPHLPPAVSGEGLIRIHDQSGRLLALARTDGTGLRPELVFAQ